MLKTFRRAAVAAALSLAAFAPAAAAGTDEKITVKGGWVQFEHRGEHLTASDTNPSHNYSVRAYLDWKDSRGRHTEFVTSWQGDTKVARKNLSIPEGTRVTLMVCYVTWQGNSRRCSLGQAATA